MSFFFAQGQYVRQDDRPTWDLNQMNIGFGIGLDHGGLGANFTYYFNHEIGAFGALGYNLVGAGWNAGIKARHINENHNRNVVPYVTGMYGCNSAVVIFDAPEYNRMFFGPTLGAGLDFGPRLQEKGYWSCGILLPIRYSSVNDYLDDLEIQGVETTDLPPITITISYKIGL
ncbi:MAG: hypothetical protein MRY83_17695 [Flavobacteriales bacterium]|nr:hypothetical protein [Flavobacteriales bacterium]